MIKIKQATKQGYILLNEGGCSMRRILTARRDEDVCRGTSGIYVLQSHARAISCALRTRAYINIPQRIEIGGELSNSLTRATKDFMVMEVDMEEIFNVKTHRQKGGDAMSNTETRIRIRKLTPKECWR